MTSYDSVIRQDRCGLLRKGEKVASYVGLRCMSVCDVSCVEEPTSNIRSGMVAGEDKTGKRAW